MADNDEPVQPIVRKGGKSETEEPTNETEAASPESESTPDPQPADEQKPEPEQPAFTGPVGRRVVDMTKPQRGTGSGSTTSPERPSVKTTQVEQGSLADFEALLAEGGAAPKRITADVGDKVQGTVTSVGARWVYIEVEGGHDGMARRDDFIDKEGRLTLTDGETYDWFVIGRNEGSILLGDQLSTRESAMDAIETAAESGIPLNGRITGKNKGGFEVDLGGVQAFCPISQIELGFCDEPDKHLGASYKFRVTEVREGGRSIVVSRAALLREESEAAREETLQTLQAGNVLSGRVTRVTDFGAFVDIGGVEGLVHVSELAHIRVDHPSELVREGESVTVTVLSVDTSDPRGVRIGLSMKDSSEDPWEKAQRDLHPGKTVNATITRLEPFGAFAEVSPNVEGLIHVSELSWDHVKRPSDVVTVGQTLAVEVIDVDLARRRISLSAKSAAGDPWNQATERYQPGIEVSGTIENVEDFGAFVSLGSGISALIPRSEMGLGREGTPHSKFSKGDQVTARVLSIEPERRRIALTMKSADEVADAADTGPRGYTDTSRGLGTFGDLLKDKLK